MSIALNNKHLCGLQLLIAQMLRPNESYELKAIVASGLESPAVFTWSGQSLVRASEGRLKEGSIYVTLQRMEERGLVTSRREMPDDGSLCVVKRLYALTPVGLSVLQRSEKLGDSQ